VATRSVRTTLRGVWNALTIPADQPHHSEWEGNLRVVRRLMEDVWAGGDLGLLTELVADSYVGHQPIGDHYGPAGARIDIGSYRQAIPDLTVTLDDLMVIEDRVIRRFTITGTHRAPLLGTPASGQRILLEGIAIDRLESSQLVESWAQIATIAR
jgi:predicted ester cyclase